MPAKSNLSPWSKPRILFRGLRRSHCEGTISLAKGPSPVTPSVRMPIYFSVRMRRKGLTVSLKLQDGFDAGRKALGEIQKLAGSFWGWLETRPFMRAKLALALRFWERTRAGRGPHRSPRTGWSLTRTTIRACARSWRHICSKSDLHDEAAALLKAFEDDISADLAFSRALLAFQVHGGCAKSRKVLTAAIAQNKHVPHYLTGKKKLPKALPDYYSWAIPAKLSSTPSVARRAGTRPPAPSNGFPAFWVRNKACGKEAGRPEKDRGSSSGINGGVCRAGRWICKQRELGAEAGLNPAWSYFYGTLQANGLL